MAQKSKALNILIVDDQETDQAAITRYLAKSNLNILSISAATTCAEALKKLSKSPACVALVDAHLPDDSGHVLTEAIGKKLPQVIVIAITRSHDGALASRLIGRGAQDCILRERLCAETLESSIRHSLERHSLVSEVEARERKLIELNRELKEDCLARSDFLSWFSHEVRTPLALVTGIADLLSNTSLDAHQTKYVQSFQRASAHMLELVNDMLDVAKTEAVGCEIAIAPFSLLRFVSEFSVLADSACQLKGLNFVSEIEPGTEDIAYSDAKALRQVLLNLLNNGIKYTQAGSIRVSIGEVRDTLGLSSKKLRITFEDTGAGIPQEQIPYLFEKYAQSQTQNFGLARSSGLGLYLTRKIIEDLGGSIRIASTSSKGTVFEIEVENQDAEASRRTLTAKHTIIGEPTSEEAPGLPR